MTKEDLRRKIAELTGFKEIPTEADRALFQWQDLRIEMSYYEDDLLDRMGVPDWPGDEGAALALMPVGCSLNRVDSDEWPGPWECTKVTDYFTMDNITRYGDTPEMAICEWYVAARDAEAVSDG